VCRYGCADILNSRGGGKRRPCPGRLHAFRCVAGLSLGFLRPASRVPAMPSTYPGFSMTTEVSRVGLSALLRRRGYEVETGQGRRRSKGRPSAQQSLTLILLDMLHAGVRWLRSSWLACRDGNLLRGFPILIVNLGIAHRDEALGSGLKRSASSRSKKKDRC